MRTQIPWAHEEAECLWSSSQSFQQCSALRKGAMYNYGMVHHATTLSALKLLAKSFDAPPIHAEVVDGGPRRGADVNHAARGAVTKFDVIGKPEQGPADRMEIVVRGCEDNRARQAREESLQLAEDDRGFP